nr:mannitol dehydrogenase family protein [Microbacterium lemovicicum]
MSPASIAAPALVRARPTPPVRIVHLGIGAFQRAHQAWYTAHAADAADWGIAAFTGRSSVVADELRAQDCLYTLIERSSEGDRSETIESIVDAHPGDDVTMLLELLRRAEVAIVTLTVTEAGYRLDDDGRLRLDDPVVAGDVDAVRATRGTEAVPPVRSVVGRLATALRARHDAGLSAVAVVPCDNIPDNGRALADACRAFVEAVDPGDSGWLDHTAAFVSTSVDRITPRTTTEDVATVRVLTGRSDSIPVVTEPFTDWVLHGRFPSGRPAWEDAGARFVTDIRPWELRKLRILNGAHTLLASFGALRGHATVDAAIRDPECRNVVERWWDEVEDGLPDGLDLENYRASLVQRFANSRIAHHLDQISQDAPAKMRIRIIPTVLHELDNGRHPLAGLTAIAAVLVCEGIRPDVTSITTELRRLSPALAARSDVPRSVADIARELERQSKALPLDPMTMPEHRRQHP